MYAVSDNGNQETYMIQGPEQNLPLTTPLGQFEIMYQEGLPEFGVDQGLYYPAATDYGYYCTGFETPVEWEGRHNFYRADGSDLQYLGSQSENSPYIYYTPGYGYDQSSYNPYNPYIPGAVMTDGSFVGSQQYYTTSPYQNSVSPGMVSALIQPDMISNGSSDPLLNYRASVANKPDWKVAKRNPASASATFSRSSFKSASNRTNSIIRGDGASRESAIRGSVSTAYSSPESTYAHQGRSHAGSVQPSSVTSDVKLLSNPNKFKAEPPVSTSFSGFGSSATGAVMLDKLQPNVSTGKTLNDANSVADTFSEPNRGPRTNRLTNELSVKSYSTKAGSRDAEGNIIIDISQYNRDEFPVDYAKAKFFVIKSYSEDDVHKSVKYNVWSSTPHGNRKLQFAYEDAQKLAMKEPKTDRCPIFLFFSVNASGQFCGVAEMIGPVDFEKDMDFWQQDKWTGCFPVKWHIIKDVPNNYFRHITLENNENRPVTNSRDTQEVFYNQGMEVLKLFKSHPVKTTLLDDFMYYEKREKILLEGKGRLNVRSFQTPILVAPERIYPNIPVQPSKDEKVVDHTVSSSPGIVSPALIKSTDVNLINKEAEQTVEAKHDVSALNFGSLTINPKEAESKPVNRAATEGAAVAAPVEIVTVGSMPIKVNGSASAESSGFLTIGSISLDPGAMKLKKGGSAESGT